jgi:hypothetical protein
MNSMRIIQGNLYMTWLDLSAYGMTSKFLSKVTTEHRQGARPSYANIPDPDDKRVCLVHYDSIPEATRLEKGIPPKAELIAQELIASRLEIDPAAMEFYLQNPNSFPQARFFARCAAYLMLAAPVTVSQARKAGFTGVDGYYQAVMEIMTREQLPVWKVTNLDRFKRRLSPFKMAVKHPGDEDIYKEALVSLISKKYGLKNASKVRGTNNQAEEIQATIIKIYADPRKFTLEETEMAYLKIAAKKHQEYVQSNGTKGWDHKCFLTQQTIANFLYDPANQQVWYASRHGESEYRKVFERNTKRIAASYANAKWVMDGTPLHRYFQDADSAYNRIHIYFIVDEYSWCILGVGVSLNGESSGQVLNALRAASQNAGLYAGDDKLYVPFEIQSDNSSANQTQFVQEAIETIGAVYRPARVGNAKAKMVEPLNKHFFARWMRFRDGFTGSMGMSTKLDNKVNQDNLTDLVRRRQLPDQERILVELQEDVMNWNNDKTWKNEGVDPDKALSPIEKYRLSLADTADRQKTITDAASVYAYYWQPSKAKQVKDESSKARKMKTVHIPQEYKYTNNGIRIERISPVTGKKVMLEFDVTDPEFNAANIGCSFTLRVEPLNYDHAFLFRDGRPVTDREGRWIKAINKETFHSALADHTEGEMKKIMEHEAIKKTQKALGISRMDFFDMKATAAGIDTGAIKNPRLFGQKETTDALKIAQSELLINGSKYHIEEPTEEVVEIEKKESKINRWEV